MRSDFVTLVVVAFVCALANACGPAAGTARGSCYPNATCNAGLVCASDTCVVLPSTGEGEGAVGEGEGEGEGGEGEGASSEGEGAGGEGEGEGGSDCSEQRVGCPCRLDSDCVGGGAVCAAGFCTRTCGAGTPVTDCNDPNIAASVGSVSDTYFCWDIGGGVDSVCWPNASGQTRTDARCHRDADCLANETCAEFRNLDQGNVRTEGACVPAGRQGPLGLVQAAGAVCDDDQECAGAHCGPRRDPALDPGPFFEKPTFCESLCASDSDCDGGEKCVVEGHTASRFAEFPTEFVGVCTAWGGSGTECNGNSACGAEEECAPYETLVAGDTAPGVAGACRAVPNPGAAGRGGDRCAADADCFAGECTFNGIIGVQYCRAPCFSDADCGAGAACRSILFDGLDPSIRDDDLRTGSCVALDLAAPCLAPQICNSCAADEDCNPAQGVTCQHNVCEDHLGRCLNPCRDDCTPGVLDDFCNGNCTDVGLDQICLTTDRGFHCVRADLPVKRVYEDGMCGDAEFPLGGGAPAPQQDLCYFGGATGPGGVFKTFLCGTACAGACGDIVVTGGTIPSTCQTVHEFSSDSSTGVVEGGAARAPQQCAPELP